MLFHRKIQSSQNRGVSCDRNAPKTSKAGFVFLVFCLFSWVNSYAMPAPPFVFETESVVPADINPPSASENGLEVYEEAILIYNHVSEMTLGKPERVELRIAFEEENLKLPVNLKGARVTNPIVVTDFMFAELIGDTKLEIKPEGQQEQRVARGGPASWNWSVIPIEAGESYMTIKIFLEDVEGKRPRPLPTYEADIRITVPPVAEKSLWQKTKLFINEASVLMAFLAALIPATWGLIVWIRRKSWLEISGKESKETTEPQKAKQLIILWVSSNPYFTNRLQLNKHFNAVNKELASTKNRDHISLVPILASTPDDLIAGVEKHKPQFLHLTGHGTSSGIKLIDEFDEDEDVLVSGNALGRFLLGKNIQCVVLNACLSKGLCAQILPSVGAVIGTVQPIAEEHAMRFAVAFYRSIGNGMSIAESYKSGSDSVIMNNGGDIYEMHGAADSKYFDQ